MKKFKIDYSFMLFLSLVILSPKQFIVFKVFLALLFHEIGHLFFIYLFKIKIKELKLSIFGFFINLENNKFSFYKDLLIYSGGILFNLILLIFNNSELNKICLYLILINLLPIYPLDGFNIIKTLVCYFFPYYYSLKVITILSIIMNIFLLIFLIYFNYDLYLIISFSYLCFLNFIYYKNIYIQLKKLIISKCLFNDYKIRYVNLKDDIERHLYKYHRVILCFNNKKINEDEFFLDNKYKTV